MAHVHDGWKRLLCILVFVIVNCVINHAEKRVPFVEKYREQLVDHFSYGKERYFSQRYLVQDKWWNPGKGPIFFYTGNEGDITTFWDNTGFVFDIAPKFQALVVFGEHRYYGKSLPFGSGSFTKDNIRYLTVEQALADYAVLIRWLKQNISAPSVPVVAFGGSYGGMLSAYLRMKYPNVISGSIAASAPVYLIAGETSRTFFFEDVTKDFRNAHPNCDSRVRQAFIEMNYLASKGAAGLDKISKDFNLCTPLSDQKSYLHLLGWIRNSFASLAMFDYPYPTVFYGPLPGYPVSVACEYLIQTADVVQGLAKAAGLFYGNPKCRDIFSEYVECADPTGCGTGPNSKAWDYQACTEMVMPAGTNNVTDMFPVLPHSYKQLHEYCLRTWGVAPRQEWMNINFWGKDLQAASNIVFSNGNLDPWHRGGVFENVSPSVVAVMIEGGAHHLDLRGANAADPVAVKKARELEETHIAQWIAQHHS